MCTAIVFRARQHISPSPRRFPPATVAHQFLMPQICGIAAAFAGQSLEQHANRVLNRVRALQVRGTTYLCCLCLTHVRWNRLRFACMPARSAVQSPGKHVNMYGPRQKKYCCAGVAGYNVCLLDCARVGLWQTTLRCCTAACCGVCGIAGSQRAFVTLSFRVRCSPHNFLALCATNLGIGRRGTGAMVGGGGDACECATEGTSQGNAGYEYATTLCNPVLTVLLQHAAG